MMIRQEKSNDEDEEADEMRPDPQPALAAGPSLHVATDVNSRQQKTDCCHQLHSLCILARPTSAYQAGSSAQQDIGWMNALSCTYTTHTHPTSL